MPVLVIYGLPCTGKTSLIKNLAGYANIAVDSIIRQKISNPKISDFLTLSDEIMRNILTKVANSNNSNIVIEMGCLIPKKSVLSFEEGLSRMQFIFSNILLTSDYGELVSRIKKRNADIDNGKSKSIKIEGPDYLTRFTCLFDENQPNNALLVDTTKKNSAEVLSAVILNNNA